MTTVVEKTHPEKTVHKFNAKIESIMEMIVKNVYKDKTASIRELISNASDAIDKYINKHALMETDAQEQVSNLKILIRINEQEKTIEIIDNGIGMTLEHLINYIGSIATSGTKEFKQDAIKNPENSGNKDSSNLIGQFGVGFYAAFLIAEKVELITKCAGHSPYKWVSKGTSEYETEELKEEDFEYNHGTIIKIFLKEHQETFLKNETIKDIVKTHCSYIVNPIYIEEDIEEEVADEEAENVAKDVTEKVETAEDVTDNVEEEDKIVEDEKVNEEEIAAPPKKKIIKRVMTLLNKSKPLWTHDPEEVTKEEYVEFYKNLTGNWDEPLAYKHVRIESIPTDYQVILFIPKQNNTNIFTAETEKNKNIKLYCNNVFITHDLHDIIPTWMGFVHGVISAPHLPINISREMLQGEKTLKQIKRILFKQTISLIEQISLDDTKFKEFYKQYSNNIKLAIKQDTSGSKQEFVNLLRYKTNKSTEPITFKKYKENIKEGQKQIYVLTALSESEALNSPFLSMFNSNDLEVFLMDSGIDEIMLQSMPNYDGLTIQRINVDGVEIPETKLDEEFEKTFDNLIKKYKELFPIDNCILKQTGKPFLISASKYGQSAAMKGLMHSQVKDSNDPYFMMMNMAKPILFINPNNIIIQKLNTLLLSEDEADIKKFEETSKVLYSTAEAECSLLFLDFNKVISHCEGIYSLIEKGL